MPVYQQTSGQTALEFRRAKLSSGLRSSRLRAAFNVVSIAANGASLTGTLHSGTRILSKHATPPSNPLISTRFLETKSLSQKIITWVHFYWVLGVISTQGKNICRYMRLSKFGIGDPSIFTLKSHILPLRDLGSSLNVNFHHPSEISDPPSMGYRIFSLWDLGSIRNSIFDPPYMVFWSLSRWHIFPTWYLGS